MESLSHCRLCAHVVNGDFKYIFSSEDDDLCEKMNTCLPITVRKTDPLPKQVCDVCLQTFYQYQNFYYQVLDAEEKLKMTWRQTNIIKQGSNKCINCPLCNDGSIGIKDGKIILGGSKKDNENGKKALGHVDNECLTQMVKQELEKGDSERIVKSFQSNTTKNYEYMCFTCGQRFVSEGQISKHDCIMLNPSEVKKPDIKGKKKGQRLKRIKSNGPAQCEICGKEYKNLERLKGHLSFCHPRVYHRCGICEKKFPKKWLLTTHMRKHTGELPYECNKCDKAFISNSQLRSHINFHHKERNLECDVCKASGFFTKQDLENHIRTKHTKERIFHCNVCNKSFMSTGVYYQHRFIHTNIRKYSCTYCSKSFRRSLALRIHMRIHKDERPFPCDLCGRAFRQRGDVKKHKSTQHRKLIYEQSLS